MINVIAAIIFLLILILFIYCCLIISSRTDNEKEIQKKEFLANEIDTSDLIFPEIPKNDNE